jgi:hypothetical protein
VQDRAHIFSCAALSQEQNSLQDDLGRKEQEAHLYCIERNRNGHKPGLKTGFFNTGFNLQVFSIKSEVIQMNKLAGF